MKMHFKLWTLLVAVCSAQGNDLHGTSPLQPADLLSDFLLWPIEEYKNPDSIEEEYDFVVVGAGPAGSVVANRLTEDPKITVLLVEAGSQENLWTSVPALHLTLYNSAYSWGYKSQYDSGVCRSMDQEICPWPSGRGLGGGTLINGMIFTRGNKQDFDQWAEQGNQGWDYDSLVKYFKKLEDLNIPELKNSTYRGIGGNLFIGDLPYRSRGSNVFLEAGHELGYPTIDYNTPYGEGFGHIQATIKNGRRVTSASAYLKPAKSRKNLHILQGALISKIIIDKTTKTAQGVIMQRSFLTKQVNARKEVIVCAGAFGSSKLLMLSGIGPKGHLESLGIDVLQDLQVGSNLQEHAGISSLVFTAKEKDFLFIPYSPLNPQITTLATNYMQHRKGPLSGIGLDAFAYLKSQFAEKVPDIELIFLGFSYNMDYGTALRSALGFRQDVYNAYWRPLQGKNTFTIAVMGCYPKSRGTVKLASRDPNVPPLINHNFFNDTTDLKVIVDGIKKAITIVKTKAMRDQGVEIYEKQQPGCEDLEYGTDEYWECAIRQITQQYRHQCGTCKMGPDSDPTAVVDPRLRVRGISKLRVVDSSIMPTITAGHTQAPSYMIGEKGADMIKEDHNLL